MKRFTITIVSALLLCTVVSAQNMRTAYFMDGYAHSFKMNPAKSASRSFFSIPVIGNLNVGVSSNLGLSSVLYPMPDGSGLTTMLNPEISSAIALDKFKANNPLAVNTDLPIVSFGFYGGKSRFFHSVDLSLVADVNASLPYDLFRFAKEGSLRSNEFDLGNTAVKANTYLSFAYGLSASVGDNIKVGARAKLLFGLAHANARLTGTKLYTGADKWSMYPSGSIEMALPCAAQIPLDSDSNIDFENFGSAFGPDMLNNIGKTFSNVGAAFDLGITWNVIKDLELSFSVTDLGFITWNNFQKGTTPKDAQGNPTEIVILDQNTTEFDNIGDKLMDGLVFKADQSGSKKTISLNPTIYLGAKYSMPFYNRLSVGVLNTTKISGVMTWTEGRFFMNLEPTNWFGITANYALSNLGNSAGAALTLHMPCINIFVGTDSYLPLTEVTPQYIPIKSLNTSVTVGLNIMISKYKGIYAKKRSQED